MLAGFIVLRLAELYMYPGFFVTTNTNVPRWAGDPEITSSQRFRLMKIDRTVDEFAISDLMLTNRAASLLVTVRVERSSNHLRRPSCQL